MKQVMTTTFHILTFLPCMLISPSYSKAYILYSSNSVFKQREPQSVIFATPVASPVIPPVLLQIPIPLFLKFIQSVNSQLHTCKLEVNLAFHIQLASTGEMLIAFL
jgi:hypothetical protein